MLSNLTFNDSLQNYSRKQILFPKSYFLHFWENPVSPYPPLFIYPVPRAVYPRQHLHHSPGAGGWALESAQGGTRTTFILRAALVRVLVETGHFTRATCGSWRRTPPKSKTKQRKTKQRKKEWYSLEQHLKCCRLLATETSTGPTREAKRQVSGMGQPMNESPLCPADCCMCPPETLSLRAKAGQEGRADL